MACMCNMALGRIRIVATKTLPLVSHSLLFEVCVIAVIRARSHIYFKNLIYACAVLQIGRLLVRSQLVSVDFSMT